MSVPLRLLYGAERDRDLVEAIARAGGLLREAEVTDAAQRIDPMELVYQRGARDLARTLIEKLGWTLRLMPPVAPAKQRQTIADADDVGGDNAVS